MSAAGNNAVFLSYASQDADAARRLADALRAAGVEVWFDRSELRGGDAWDQKIRQQIKECALFVPIISANTQARAEGYFRLEWKLADRRTDLIGKSKAFLLPVCIDDTRDAEADVPDSFLAVQWLRLPGGEATAAFAVRVKALLEGEGGRALPTLPRAAQTPESMEPALSRSSPWPHWAKPALAGVVIMAIAVGAILWQRRTTASAEPATPAPPPNTAPARPASPADQLVGRATAILDGSARSREQIDAANGLLEQAMALEPTNAAAWTAAARADLMLIYPYGYDRSDERRQRAMSRAARAVNLAPDSLATRVVQTSVMAHASGNPALTREAEQTFRQMIRERPGDLNLELQLAEVLREERRFPEAAALFERIGQFELASWSWFLGGDFPAAYGPVQRAVSEQRTTTAVQLKANIEAHWFEDLARAQATVDRLLPSELQAEITAAIAIRLAFLRRDSERMLQLLTGLPQDFLDSIPFVGPRQYWTGWAYQIAGRTERAKIEWRKGLVVLQAARAAAPDRVELLEIEAEIHALLGENADGERALAEAERIAGASPGTVNKRNYPAHLALRHYEPALAWLDTQLRKRTDPQWPFDHAVARFSPVWDGLRVDPRFEKLLRETKPEGAVPFDDVKPAEKL